MKTKDIFKTLTNEFLFHCKFEKNLSQHTLKAYRQDLKQFEDHLSLSGKIVGIENIGKSELRNYLQYLGEKYKVKSVKRKIATLKAFFTYLEYEDRIAISPFRKMRIKIKEPLVLPVAMTLTEIKRLFRIAYRAKQESMAYSFNTYRAVVRDIVVLELLFATGIRVSELCGLQKRNVNIEQRYILVEGKGSRERVIQICSPEIITVIKEYLELFHRTNEVMPYFLINRLGQPLSPQSVRTVVKKYAQSANIEKSITPHMFRHTFATLLLEEEVDIRYIQQLLGHSTITTTQIYTHITLNKQKEILTSRHPRGSIQIIQ